MTSYAIELEPMGIKVNREFSHCEIVLYKIVGKQKHKITSMASNLPMIQGRSYLAIARVAFGLGVQSCQQSVVNAIIDALPTLKKEEVAPKAKQLKGKTHE